jgi:uncharacterized protein (TIGR00730 family)
MHQTRDTDDSEWDIETINRELLDAERALREIGPAVSMFGSSRVDAADPLAHRAFQLARELSAAGFAIITGGGPGLMDSFNRGAREGGSPSVGLGIRLPGELQPNPHIDIHLRFERFFTRKAVFVRYSRAFVVMPGGWGTLDELFEVLCLMSTQKVAVPPVALVGDGYWDGLLEWLETGPAALGMIDRSNLRMLRRVATAGDILALIRERGG